MIVRIAKDTPKELIALGKRIDFSQVPKSEFNAKLIELSNLVIKYKIPIRKHKVEAMEIELGDCPQDLATFISKLDFRNYSTVTRKIAISFIENWLKKNNYLR